MPRCGYRPASLVFTLLFHARQLSSFPSPPLWRLPCTLSMWSQLSLPTLHGLLAPSPMASLPSLLPCALHGLPNPSQPAQLLR